VVYARPWPGALVSGAAQIRFGHGTATARLLLRHLAISAWITRCFLHLAGGILNCGLRRVEQVVARFAHPLVFLARLRNGKSDRRPHRECNGAYGQGVLVHRAIEAILRHLCLVLSAGLHMVSGLLCLIHHTAHAILRARRELARGLAGLPDRTTDLVARLL